MVFPNTDLGQWPTATTHTHTGPWFGAVFPTWPMVSKLQADRILPPGGCGKARNIAFRHLQGCRKPVPGLRSEARESKLVYDILPPRTGKSVWLFWPPPSNTCLTAAGQDVRVRQKWRREVARWAAGCRPRHVGCRTVYMVCMARPLGH